MLLLDHKRGGLHSRQTLSACSRHVGRLTLGMCRVTWEQSTAVKHMLCRYLVQSCCSSIPASWLFHVQCLPHTAWQHLPEPLLL